ncbi:hypothetical protein [Rhodococcus sp. M8-35]|uniref:hypothetical protein n=1 Tax=Rhodococcus sp. M8-35 TaxID=3058401 RepID=UPI002ED58D26
MWSWQFPTTTAPTNPHAPSFERRLREEIERLAREMRTEHADLGAALEVITRAAVELIPGARGNHSNGLVQPT